VGRIYILFLILIAIDRKELFIYWFVFILLMHLKNNGPLKK